MPIWTKKGRPQPKASIFAGIQDTSTTTSNSTKKKPAATTTRKAATTTTNAATHTNRAAASPTKKVAAKPAPKPAPKTTATSLMAGKKVGKPTARLLGGKPTNKTGASVVQKKLDMAAKTKILSLTEHRLEDIPSQVFQIKAMKTLDVSHNKLRRLGNQLAVFEELKSLNISHNNISPASLTPEIGKLNKLQTLTAGGNQLGLSSNLPSLPPNLKQLTLDHNGFKLFPSKMILVSPLTHLEKLDLSFNNLSQLPPEIGELVALRDLNLEKNQLTKLPPQIGQLAKLKALSLQHNKIVSSGLPASLFADTLVADLNLEGNPMTSTQLNELEGYSDFLERRQKIKSKDLYGGALTNLDVCGLK